MSKTPFALIAIGLIGGMLLLVGGGNGPTPGPGPDRSDLVAEVFQSQESAFRRLSGERAKALRSGQITSEKASADWMASKYLPESDAAWSRLLTAEAAEFGGKNWTAEKEAATIERYAR